MVISMGKEKVVVEVADPSRHRPGTSGRLAGVSILPDRHRPRGMCRQ